MIPYIQGPVGRSGSQRQRGPQGKPELQTGHSAESRGRVNEARWGIGAVRQEQDKGWSGGSGRAHLLQDSLDGLLLVLLIVTVWEAIVLEGHLKKE